MISPRDYVVQTNPCTEVLAKSNLEARGFDVYLPTIIAEHRHGRMREQRLTAVEPLFPGYLFVKMWLGDPAWRLIGAVRGVKRLLGRDSEHPTPLPDGALDDLRERFAAGEFVRRDATYRVSAGDTVTITGGYLEGHTGICTVSKAERVKVMLSLFGSARSVEMPANMVQVAASG